MQKDIINLAFKQSKESLEHFTSTIEPEHHKSVFEKLKQAYHDAYNAEEPELLERFSVRISNKSELEADFKTRGYHIDKDMKNGGWTHTVIVEFIGTSS